MIVMAVLHEIVILKYVRGFLYIFLCAFNFFFAGVVGPTEPQYHPTKVPSSVCGGPRQRDGWKPTVLGDTIMLRRNL